MFSTTLALIGNLRSLKKINWKVKWNFCELFNLNELCLNHSNCLKLLIIYNWFLKNLSNEKNMVAKCPDLLHRSTVVGHNLVPKMAIITFFFFCKVHFKRKKSIFFFDGKNLKTYPMILRRLFSFCRFDFLSYSPLVNIYRLHNNIATNHRKKYGKTETSRHTDVRFRNFT